ncbi:O-antigen polysaccharide polymerase Wzy [Edwardsiella piscicida]|uniref:O-antigen polysaccharide polymerase Wzy n=1 Tax=Edwardsiella piscicida TaxID=1263550 RepID=UPI00370DC8C1
MVNNNNKRFVFFQLIIYVLMIPVLFFLFFQHDGSELRLLELALPLFIICIFISNFVCKIYINSTYCLFLIAFSLFICGRFFIAFIGGDVNVFSMNFFVNYTLNDYDAVTLTLYIFVFLCSMDFGYKIAFFSNLSFKPIALDDQWMRRLCNVALLLSPLFLIELMSTVLDAIRGGYLASKLWQDKAYSLPLSSLAQTIFAIGFSYAIVVGYRKKWFVGIYITTIICSTVIGARGPLLVSLLLLVWLIGRNGAKNLGVLRFLTISLISVILLSAFIQIMSYRGSGSFSDFSLVKFLSTFLFNQGVSLMVFDLSTKVSNYPILSYFQTIFPGASAITSIFIPVEYYMTGFQHYMAKTLDESLFARGFGLDWTLISDFYVFGGRNILGFSLLAFSFGLLLSTLQNASKNLFWLVLLTAIFTRLVFLPRSSLVIISPFCFYFLFFVFLMPKIKLGIKK